MKTKKEIENICSNIVDSESINDQYKQSVYEGCVLGYTKCQEDNKDKKYTEEDMINAFNSGYDIRSSYGDRDDNMTAEQFINSLNKQD
jgi:hypothetical protein